MEVLGARHCLLPETHNSRKGHRDSSKRMLWGWPLPRVPSFYRTATLTSVHVFFSGVQCWVLLFHFVNWSWFL